jgi:hypothetical protein
MKSGHRYSNELLPDGIYGISRLKISIGLGQAHVFRNCCN